MRQSRIKGDPLADAAHYHCVSRVVDRQFVLGEPEKEHFVRLMRLYEAFCGVNVLTFCVMSNHFHILLEVPRRPDGFTLSDEELIERLRPVNSPLAVGTLRQRLAMLRASGSDTEAEALKARHLARMFDLSAYMKLLKGRFTQWFNNARSRCGTLWEERFKSVLVEGSGDGEALLAISAYIDLNPVRAAICQDPKDYRWCGHAEAVAGVKTAIAGAAAVLRVWEAAHGATAPDEPAAIIARYRQLAYERGQEIAPGANGESGKRGLTREQIAEVVAKGGKLTRWEMLRCRVRHFTDGAVIGGAAFVNAVFQAHRPRFGPKRQTGARPLRQVETSPLRTLRDLRLNPVG